MYRNVYLECYKSATAQQQNVQFLICHFNHAYVALGSILNDIEYAIGKLLSVPRASTASTVQEQLQQDKFKEKLVDKSRKSIESLEGIGAGRQSLQRFSKPHELPRQSQKDSKERETTNPSMEFDQMFRLNKPLDTPSGLTPSPSKNMPSPAVKPTKQPDKSTKTSTPGDDFLDELFSKR